jgi:hypothetical protein
MWVIFRSGCLRQFASLDTKIARLERLGSPYQYSYDMNQVMAAISRGEIKDLGDPVKNYAQGENYIIIGDISSTWAKLKAGKRLVAVTKIVANLTLANKDTPEKFFSQIDRGLLRSLWGADKEEWVELPGPAEWWPDEPTWYSANGFEPSPDQQVNYRKALFALDSESCIPGWEQELLHDHAPFDLVWNKTFSLFGV